MRYITASLLIMLSAAAIPPRANTATEILDLLPDEHEVRPWSAVQKPEEFSGVALYEYINGGAELYYEYGFKTAVTQEYTSGVLSLIVEIYKMEDAQAAFGIYSLQRDPQRKALEIGDDATLFDYHLSFCQDSYYVAVMGYQSSDTMRAALELFAGSISAKIKVKREPPPLLASLPARGRVARSERWIEGPLGLNTVYYFGQENVWGIDGLAVTAAAAEYSLNANRTCALLLVEYENAELAAKAESEVMSVFKEKLTKAAAPSPQINSWRDDRGRVYLLARRGIHVASVLRGDDRGNAVVLLEQTLNSPSTTY